jgi:hypothetical protein
MYRHRTTRLLGFIITVLVLALGCPSLALPQEGVGPISGRAVGPDETPLPAESVWVVLEREDFPGIFVNVKSLPASETGEFSFVTDEYGQPLRPGPYRVVIPPFAYRSPVRWLGWGEGWDLGTIVLVLPPRAGPVSGEVVGEDGNQVPFGLVWVTLERFEEDWGSYSFVNGTYDNPFSFECYWDGTPLGVGNYRVTVYPPPAYESVSFTRGLAEGEPWDLGTIALILPPRAGPVSGDVVGEDGHRMPSGSVWVTLERFEEDWGHYESVNGTGNTPFFFELDWYGAPLRAGDYRLSVYPQPPYESTSFTKSLAEGEAWDLGTILIVRAPQAGPVTGRVVGPGGHPLPSYSVAVVLQRSLDGEFQEVTTTYPGFGGEFSFTTDPLRGGLFPGLYRVEIRPPRGYSGALLGPEELEDGEAWHLGTIALEALPQAKSIAGRLVDRWTLEPLQGDLPPYAQIQLVKHNEEGWSEWSVSQPANGKGEFLFTPDNAGGLYAGTYYVEVLAYGYQRYRSESFFAGPGAAVVLNDLVVTPFPIEIANPTPCEPLPGPGGVCSYGFQVINRTPERFQGAAWSLIYVWGTGSPLERTNFQTASKGTKKPVEKLSLKGGESAILTFEFTLPTGSLEGGMGCVSVLVGQDPDPFFGTVAGTTIFCLQPTPAGLSLVPEPKVRKMARGRWDAPASFGPEG